MFTADVRVQVPPRPPKATCFGKSLFYHLRKRGIMKHSNFNHCLVGLFLLVELILYYLILTTSGMTLTVCCYGSIVICLLYALVNVNRFDPWILFGLVFTAAADYFLVICSPIQQLQGMLFFLVTQTLYAIRLHRSCKYKWFLWLRSGLILCAEAVTVAVLKDKLDSLAVVSICYYVNLIVNLIMSFAQFRENKLFAIGMVLFLLCDTVIGLQVASGAYLSIPETSLLYRIIFMDFFLSWFFYLPSQVFITLSGCKHGGVKKETA